MTGAASWDEAQPLIQVRDVSKVFSARPSEALAMLAAGESKAEVLAKTGTIVGLNRVSFDVAKGEVLVIMGLSGSGKSTTLRCLNRLIEPSSGSILVQGQDVVRMSPRELRDFRRDRFGMVFQHFALFPHRTILANVEFGLEVQGMVRRLRRSASMAAIELVGLGGWEDKYPSDLSGGMKQRAGLARALAADADVLLMDEAFSALDPLIRRDMQEELVALQARLRKTIVFVSHDLDEAIALGGRIVLMKDGAIVQSGTAEQILLRPATSYVERFVAHIDVASVLKVAGLLGPVADHIPDDADVGEVIAHMTALGREHVLVADARGRLMGRARLPALRLARRDGKPVGHAVASCARVSGQSTLKAALPMIAAEADPVAVVDEAGMLLGAIGHATVVNALARTNQSAEPSAPISC